MSTRAIHGRKLLPFKRESGVLYCSFFVGLFASAVAKDIANFYIAKHRGVKIDRFFCFSADVANKHKRRNYSLFDLTVAHEHHLPRKTVPILRPSVFLAE
jgi:hypothetical protein